MIGLESVRRDMADPSLEESQVVPARLLRPEQLAIRYPNTATEGTVVVHGEIGTDGYPIRMTVASDPGPEFDDVVLTALKAVHWEPARVRGSAVEGPIDMTIDFVLRRPE